MSQESNRILQHVRAQCQRYFDVKHVSDGPYRYDPAELDEVPHPEWIPAVVMEYGRETNGFFLKWTHTTAGEQYPDGTGAVQLAPLSDLYGDWQDYLMLSHEPAESRLHQFKLVDSAHDYLLVGLYHDAAQDPGLYIYNPDYGEPPYPLYLDLPGYIALLEHTLGYSYWQTAVLALLPADGRNPAYRSDVELTAELRRDLTAWGTGFDYEAFVARYHEVKLKNYIPSGL
jgi:hypothetical protein